MIEEDGKGETPAWAQTYQRQMRLASPVSTVFDWHCQPDAIHALMPPDKTVEVVCRTGGIDEENAELVFRIYPLGKWLPFYITWRARHYGFQRNQQFIDVQEEGPFAYWLHRHRFESSDPAQCNMVDEVTYRLPLAPLSHWFVGWWINRELDGLFAYRHQVLADRFGVLEGDVVQNNERPLI